MCLGIRTTDDDVSSNPRIVPHLEFMLYSAEWTLAQAIAKKAVTLSGANYVYLMHSEEQDDVNYLYDRVRVGSISGSAAASTSLNIFSDDDDEDEDIDSTAKKASHQSDRETVPAAIYQRMPDGSFVPIGNPRVDPRVDPRGNPRGDPRGNPPLDPPLPARLIERRESAIEYPFPDSEHPAHVWSRIDECLESVEHSRRVYVESIITGQDMNENWFYETTDVAHSSSSSNMAVTCIVPGVMISSKTRIVHTNYLTSHTGSDSNPSNRPPPPPPTLPRLLHPIDEDLRTRMRVGMYVLRWHAMFKDLTLVHRIVEITKELEVQLCDDSALSGNLFLLPENWVPPLGVHPRDVNTQLSLDIRTRRIDGGVAGEFENFIKIPGPMLVGHVTLGASMKASKAEMIKNMIAADPNGFVPDCFRGPGRSQQISQSTAGTAGSGGATMSKKGGKPKKTRPRKGDAERDANETIMEQVHQPKRKALAQAPAAVPAATETDTSTPATQPTNKRARSGESARGTVNSRKPTASSAAKAHLREKV